MIQTESGIMDACIRCVRIFVFLLVAQYVSLGRTTSDKPHSRQKRILWITSDGRLALPPGTTLVVSPSLSLPFVRYPPEGFFSNLTISLPFTIDFNKLGLTDNENPYGVLPPLLARSMGHTAGAMLANYLAELFQHRRHKRASPMKPPPPETLTALHGGERAFLYTVVEDFLASFGMDGKACLLRAICEVHAHPLQNYGLVGEMLKLFFSASKSPYADIMNEYVEAEKAGAGADGVPGECWPYLRDCPKSLFMQRHNPYTSETSETSETSGTSETNGEYKQNEVSDTQDDVTKVIYNPGNAM